MKKKITIFLMLIVFSLFLASCGKNNNNNNNGKEDEVVLSNVIFKDNISMFQFDLESFRLKDIKLELVYSDNSKKEVEVNKNMISGSDFKALLTTGQYFININYLDYKLEALIEMSSKIKPQTHLPAVAIYSLVKEEDNKTIYDVYSAGSGNYFSFMMKINHGFKIDDTSIVEVLDGVFSAKILAKGIDVIYSFSEAVSGDQHLFSIVVEGVSAKDLIFNEEDSLFLTFVNNKIVEVTDVRYFVR